MGSFSRKIKALGVLFGVMCGTGALACAPSISVRVGDTLFSIAEEQLGNASLWSHIFYANPDVLGSSLLDIDPGTVLRIPCPGLETAPEVVAKPVAIPPQVAPASPMPPAPPVPQARSGAGVRILGRADFPPFSDVDWPARGMLSELVAAAFDVTPAPVAHDFEWRGAWSDHLFPLLDSKEFDIGFPWFKPDCALDPDNRICARFHFSDPLVDVVILLFARADAPLPFEVDSDMHGRTLCRPEGYFTHDLDRPDRLWLSRGLVLLEQPETVENCFEMLMAGDVDAVALNEFLGVQKMFERGLTETVAPLPRPLSVEGLHAVISKSHWRGTAHLYRLNAGLAKLRQSERYGEIVSRHLAQFWDLIKS